MPGTDQDPDGVIRIALVDDHAIVRRGLRLILDAEDDFDVVAEGGDLADARRVLLGHKPDVLVLDLNMPGEPSMPAIPGLLSEFPNTKIVVLTMQSDAGFARAALQGGAVGYVLKEAIDAELVEAIRLARRGEVYLNPRLGGRLAAAPPPPEPSDDLTPRERDVLRLIALGHTNPEIAGQLVLSVRTVETHRAHIVQKLGLHTRAQLVGHALKNGFLTTE